MTKTEITINDTAIPAALRNAKRWIRWHWGEKNGKLAKIPQKGWTQPDSWLRFDDLAGDGDGAGFVLGNGIGGVDADKCRDDCTGELSEMAKDIIALADSY